MSAPQCEVLFKFVDDFPAFPPYAFSVRAYLTFQNNRGWHFHLLSADCRTALTPWKQAADIDSLLGIIKRLHGDVRDVERDVRRWNRGGTWVDLSPAQCRYFGMPKY